MRILLRIVHSVQTFQRQYLAKQFPAKFSLLTLPPAPLIYSRDVVHANVIHNALL